MKKDFFIMAFGQVILLPCEFGATYLAKCENNFTWGFFAAIIGICITVNFFIASFCMESK